VIVPFGYVVFGYTTDVQVKNIIIPRPGTNQFIPEHVEDVKDVFQEMWGHKTVTIFLKSRSLNFIDMRIANSLSEKKCSKRFWSVFSLWSFKCKG